MPHLRRSRPAMALPLVLVALALTACSSPEPEPPVSDVAVADASAPLTYRCESGRTVEASYPTNSTAVVQYEGQTYPMTIAVSASGARYVGEGFEWWTKGSGPGSEGTLFRHQSDGTSGEQVDQCSQS